MKVSKPTYETVASREVIERVARLIARCFDPEQIILFGSHAAGVPAPGSDVDLLIVMETDRPHHERSTCIRAMFRPSPFPMDVFVFTPEEVEYWQGTVNHIITEALENGEVLYGRQE